MSNVSYAEKTTTEPVAGYPKFPQKVQIFCQSIAQFELKLPTGESKWESEWDC